MHCVVYEFKVKKGRNEDFEKAWAGWTDSVYRVCGSLGARLHTTKDPQIYMAYAQWPTRQIMWQGFAPESYEPEEWRQHKLLGDALESSKIVYETEMFDDRLQRVALVTYEPEPEDDEDDEDVEDS